MLQVDTEVCEQVFSWLSRYKRITQKMNQHTFMFFCSICVILTTYMRKKTLQGCFYVEHVQLYCLWLYSYYMYMYMQNEIQKISTDWTKQIPWAYAYSPIHPLGTEGLNQQLERRAGLHLTHGILLTVSHHVELCPEIILWHNSWDPPDSNLSCSVT